MHLDGLIEFGTSGIPLTSVHSVTVPGAVDAWDRMLRSHGTFSFSDVLAPAIDYAERGFVVAERTASDWGRETEKLRGNEGARQHLLKSNGHVPDAGEIFSFPALARTMRVLAREGRDAFYEGDIAKNMLETLREHGGFHDETDFAEYGSYDVQPISTTYRGVECFQIPPAGQGITALLMLNILAGFDKPVDPFGADRFHLQIEASRWAYQARDAFIADPAFAEIPIAKLLSDGFAEDIRERIDLRRAAPHLAALPSVYHRDTVYVTVVDAQGNACSLINSLFHAFGSGIACPKTGIVFHNRGAGFRTIAGHPNAAAPRKRPLHTIIPGFAMKNGRPWLSFGVMGGAYQPVGQVHVLQNLIDYRLDVQEALDAPRGFRGPDTFEAERMIEDRVLIELAERGHPIKRADVPLGGAQAILIEPLSGILYAGSDPRKDGCALAI
jgi:gamma-glutamyltranspeptidase/glutathione hydrolase